MSLKHNTWIPSEEIADQVIRIDPIPDSIRWAVWMAQMQFHVELYHPDWLDHFQYWLEEQQTPPTDKLLRRRIATYLEREWGYTHSPPRNVV